MSKEKIYQALIAIEKDCKYSEMGDGYIEQYIDTSKFYNRVKGLMAVLNQNKDEYKSID